MAAQLFHIPGPLVTRGVKRYKPPGTKKRSHRDEKHSTGSGTDEIVITPPGDRGDSTNRGERFTMCGELSDPRVGHRK